MLKNGAFRQLLFAGSYRVSACLGCRVKAVPGMYRNLMPSRLYKKIESGEGEIGLLYLDQRFEKKLESGVYYFWNYARKVTCRIFNMKLQQIELSGQEILTADKVGVRLNLIGSYRITDPVRLAQSIDDLKEQLHVYIQLISREYCVEREEVASTRSLLNTAKLMEENKTLYRLKELEYLERICDRVGSISLSGGTGILEQLTQLILFR